MRLKIIRERDFGTQLPSIPGRFYGDGTTIHGTTAIDVEVEDGVVVAVWYRCQMLPFVQHDAKGSSVGRGNPNIKVRGVIIDE
jgi:hypothetical protein